MAAAEQKKNYHVTKAVRGINTKANRTAIQPDEFAWLENAMPLGDGNIKITPAQQTQNASGNAVAWSNAVSSLSSVTLKNDDYVIGFHENGQAQFYNIEPETLGNVAVAGTFSNSGVRLSAWNNERAMIADPEKGLYTWNSTATVFVGSVGVIALKKQGSGYTAAPAVTISAPNDTNGTQAVAEATISGGIVESITLTEPGTGYNTAPTITLTGGGGTGAEAVGAFVTFANGTVSCVVKSGGVGYTNVSNITVTISGGGGTNAAGVAITRNNAISQIVMTNPGNGYTSNPTVTIAGDGSNAVVEGVAVTTPVTDVASFSGRVWISQGRIVYYSAAGAYNDFTSVSAGNVEILDSTLHDNIRFLLPANNFLYVFGESSINVFSDVRVTTSGATLFTNTNLSASVGSDLTFGAFPYFRSVLFMNRYGIYALVGATTTKLSDSLDGIFPYIDFTLPVTSGQVLINNILCSCFNFYYNDPLSSLRAVQAVFFDKKWFITSQGDLKRVTALSVGGQMRIYGTNNTNLVRLYTDTSGAISSTIRTALWPLGDPIRTKQALKFGIEATIATQATLGVTVDSETSSSPVTTLGNSSAGWLNNSGVLIPWVNNSSQTIGWLVSGGYYLYKYDAQQYGKYLGLTVTSTDPAFTVNTFELEHELRARF